MNAALVQHVGQGWFPTAAETAAYGVENLQKDCGLGYRARTLSKLAQQVSFHQTAGSLSLVYGARIGICMDAYGWPKIANMSPLRYTRHGLELFRRECLAFVASNPLPPRRWGAGGRGGGGGGRGGGGLLQQPGLGERPIGP